MNIIGTIKWRIVVNSVMGTSHKRSGKPNQDRIKFSYPDNFSLPLILAVADGHGAKSYFRSDKGAEFATEIAIDICKDLDKVSWDEIKNKKIIDLLCRDIVQKWLDRVNSDIKSNPFSEEERSFIKTKKEQISKRPIAGNIEGIVAYGSTLIIAVILETYIFYLQLGDGDVLLVSSTGDIDKPIPKDERLLGNETTSLCEPESWSDFRFRLLPIDATNPPPAIILLSTDGYGNSFSNESEFEKVGNDLLEMICEHRDGMQEGIESIQENLPDWLMAASEKGSGDDTTVGIICNKEQIKRYREDNYDIVIRKKVKKIQTSDIESTLDTLPPSTETIPNEKTEPVDTLPHKPNSIIDSI